MNEMSGDNAIENGLEDAEAFAESLSDVDAAAGSGAPADRSAGRLGQVASDDDDGLKQPSWVGRTLGHFKLLGPLGEGAMGLVIRAQDVNLGRIVALKVLRKRIDGMDDEQRVSQFLREARAAAQIEHPNIARVYEINQHDGWWYFATELVEGGSLRDAVRAAGRLSPAQACPLIADAAAALAVAHALGIVHRDIKPRNLMISRSGRCKVVDFGLVRLEDPDDPFDFTSRAVGTPLYLAPEVRKRVEPTGAVDVYGLGASLYFALAGRPPFVSKDVKKLIRMHAEAPRPDVREHNPDCSEAIANLIKRAMSIDPEVRPGADEMAAALSLEGVGARPVDSAAGVVGAGSSLDATPHAGSGSITDASGVAEHSRRRRRTFLLAALAVVITAGGIVAITLWQSAQTAGPAPGPNREAFAAMFPDAPASYGAPSTAVGATHDAPADAIPEWSWRAHRDPGDARFIAHVSGQRYYRIDAPEAAFIVADKAVFFDDEAAARASGRSPARSR